MPARRIKPALTHRLQIGLAFIWLAVLPASAQNTVLHLRNGDRLTGRIIAETTNSVTLATEFSERVEIPVRLVEKRDVLNSGAGTAKADATTPAPTKPTAPATGVVSEMVSTNRTPAGTKIVAAKPATPAAKPPEPSAFRKFLDEWRGEAQLGANLGFSAKDREAFTGHFRLNHNHHFAGTPRALRNILDYDVIYGTTDNVISDNRMDGTWKIEYDLSRRFLIYNNLAAGYDEIRQIDFQYDFGPGLGYKWIVLTNFVFKTEVGGDYQEQFFARDKRTSRYSLRLEEDLWWQISPKLRWDERVEFFPQIDEFGDYRIRVETNLSYLLRQNLTLTLNVVDLYDTALLPGVTKNDLQIRSLVGIRF